MEGVRVKGNPYLVITWQSPSKRWGVVVDGERAWDTNSVEIVILPRACTNNIHHLVLTVRNG